MEDVGAGLEVHGRSSRDGHRRRLPTTGFVASDLWRTDVLEASIGLEVYGLTDVLPVTGAGQGGEGV